MERFHKIGKQSNAHQNGIWGLAEISEEQREMLGDFVSGGADGLLKSWRFRKEEQTLPDEEGDAGSKEVGPVQITKTFEQHALPVVHVAVSRKSPVAASTSLDGVVKIWNLADDTVEAKNIQQMGVTESWDIAISADGQRVVTGGAKGAVEIIDTNLKTVEETFSITASSANGKETPRRDNVMVMSIALSDDDSKMALGAHDGTVTVLDVETGKPVCDSMARHGGPVRSISFLPNEQNTVITGSDDQLINLYDIKSSQVTGNCRGHAGMVFSVRGSKDGKYLVSGGSDWTVRVWDRVMRESVYSDKSHTDSVWGVCYAAQGSRVVSVSDDGCIGVLDSSKADSVS